MIFYSLLLLSSIILVFFSQFVGKRRSMKLCILVTLVLGAVASLRGYVGTDTYSYHLQFDWITSQEYFDAKLLIIEPAFVLIAKLVELVGGDSFAYVASIGILQTLLIIFILRRIERPEPFLIFYIATFYINFHFNIIRASTATLFIMISLMWIKEGGYKFLIPLWASVFFHYTAILFVAYVMLYKQFKEKKYVYLPLLILLILAAVFGIITMFSDVLYLKYGGYLEDLEVVRGLGIGLLLQLVLYVGLGVITFKRSKMDMIFFALPVVLIKILSVPYPILGRLEAFSLPLFLLVLTKDAVYSWQRELSSGILVVLSLLNVYSVVSGLPAADTQGGDLAHISSPYIPYHTLFEAK